MAPVALLALPRLCASIQSCSIVPAHTLPSSSAGAACSCPSPAAVSFGSWCFFAALGQSHSGTGPVLE